jgi:hypothetical protein
LSGFAVTKGARRVTKIGGTMGREEKALANRRNRRRLNEDLRINGEDAALTPILFTDWDVI